MSRALPASADPWGVQALVAGERRAMPTRARLASRRPRPWPLVALLLLAVLPTAGASRTPDDPPPEPAADRPRLIVLTDISSLTAGEAEPDDGQSLIRLMLYTNEFDVEGLVASSNLGHGPRVRPDLIRTVIGAYRQVEANLRRHDARYPAAATLLEAVKAGQPVAGPDVPVADCVGPGRDTEASRHLVTVVDRPDPRPVWVLVWGGSADLAQALWHVRATRTPEELARFVARLRVHAIGDQDATGPWIRAEFPGLLTITQRRAYRGVYRDGDPTLCDSAWVRAHIHGHGALGDLYPDYRGGDIWSARIGPVRGIKEGDTPSFLALVPNGLTDLAHPELGSWGGRFAGEAGRLTDVPDADLVIPGDLDPRMSSVHRWRPAFQADFQARLDACVRPVAKVNHPPRVQIAGDRDRQVRPGDVLVLDAGRTADPDRDALDFAWSIYPATPGAAPAVGIDGQDTRLATVVIPRESAGQTIAMLLTVTDRGSPRLTRYARVLLHVEAAPDR